MKKSIMMISGAVVMAVGLAGAAQAFGGKDHGGRGHKGGLFMFEQMDLNNDGQITKEEMAQAKEKRFTDADADGDGFLTREELTAQAEKRNADRMTQRIDRMMSHVDANEDGKISKDEAANMGPSQERADKMFAKLDTNSDGAISKDEIQAMKGKRKGFGRWKKDSDQ
ncbi:MAG: EF-hand domain-containing protein [Pelagimonas sp.]|jgi:hypothetical protein|nr:EF-hand domain-containing protein [Pelagimonas sp.]